MKLWGAPRARSTRGAPQAVTGHRRMVRSTSLTGGVAMGGACGALPVGSARAVDLRPAGTVPVGRGGAAPGLAGVGPSLPGTGAGVGEEGGAAGSGPDRSAAGDASASAVAASSNGPVDVASLDEFGPQPTRLTTSANATMPARPARPPHITRSLPNNQRIVLIASGTARRSSSGQAGAGGMRPQQQGQRGQQTDGRAPRHAMGSHWSTSRALTASDTKYSQ